MAEEKREWHLERGVSIAQIISTIMLFMALAGSYSALTERIAVMENQQSSINERMVRLLESQNRTDTRQDAELLEIKRQIREDYKEILNKLSELERRS